MDATLDYIEKRGREEGEKCGETRGLNLAAELYRVLAEDNRLDEWNDAVNDRDKMMNLLREYSLLGD